MPVTHNSMYRIKSAVLFVIFNRPDTTALVFDKIREAKPKKLYIAADAPRRGNAKDELNCKQVKDIVSHIDWDCELKTLYRTENGGCKDAVSAAITWFFENEEEGIILEDDCLPASSFFRFCDEMLERYRDDRRIRHITGCNLQEGIQRGAASYYFSNRVHVWGWASWRRVWNEYDIDLEKYSSEDAKKALLDIYNDPMIANIWTEIFNKVKKDELNSWAYPLDFINFFNNGLVIIPNKNLISNIGFGTEGTHSTTKKGAFDHVPLAELEEITHPVFIVPDKEADLLVIDRDFKISERKRKQKALKTKVKRWFRFVFQHAAV